MEILNTSDIIELCNGNHTLASEYLRISRGSARKYIESDRVIVVDGEVYVKQSKVSERVLLGNRKSRFDQYIDLVQTVLNQTGSTKETADLMCECEPGKKRTQEKVEWCKRIDRWLNDGKLVV